MVTMVTMRRTYYVDEDDVPDIIPPGSTLRVPLRLHDARARRLTDHQPGYRVGDAADRRAVRVARQDMIDRATSAWRTDARRKKPDDDDENNNNDRRRGAADARTAARDAYVRRLTSAWKTPQRDMNPHGGLTCPKCHGAGKVDGRECPRCDGEGYIEDYPAGKQWEPKDRGAPDPGIASSRPFNQPDNSSSPETMRRYLQGERDAAWARYRDNLSTAWRQGRTDPAAASKIEAERERWLGK
jgi:hypothetical protein